MYSEHLTNVHPGWVVGGWLVSVAVFSAAFLVFVGLGLMDPGLLAETVWIVVAVAAGFFVGGLFVGLRWTDAPILHGIAITILSMLVWFLGNVLLPTEWGGGGLEEHDAAWALGMILVQLAAAVAGGWAGRKIVLRGVDLDPAAPKPPSGGAVDGP